MRAWGDISDATGFMKFVRRRKYDCTDEPDEPSPMHAAAWGCPDYVIRFCQSWRGGHDYEDKRGRTPMHYAAMNGNTQAFDVLLEFGADIDALDNDGCTPVHCAVRCMRFKAASRLSVLGSQAHLIRNKAGDTPLLHWVKTEGGIDPLGFEDTEWIKREDVLSQDSEGLAVFHILAVHGIDDELCLFHGVAPEFVHVRCNRGKTVLHYAVTNYDDEVVRLLHDYGADLDAQDNDGQTAMHLVAGHVEATNLLIELGSRAFWMENASGRTPRDYMERDEVEAAQRCITGRSLLDTLLATPRLILQRHERVGGADHGRHADVSGE